MLTRHPLITAALALVLAACAGDDDAAQPDASPAEPTVPDARVQGSPADAAPDAAPDARLPTPVLVVSARQVAVVEGATATVTVRLDAAPAAPIDVAVASSATAAFRVAPATLRFDAATWSAPQTVTVTAVEDDDSAAARGSIIMTAAGLADATIAVDIADNDGPVAISAPANLLVAEGNDTLFAVTLTRAPTRAVEVTVTSRAPSRLAATPAALSFTPTTWNVPQLVTVTASTDADLADDQVSIDVASAGLPTVVVTALVTDTTLPRVAFTPAALQLDEGNLGSFRVTLLDRPARDTVVSLVASEPDAVAMWPRQMTFTAASFDQPVTVAIAAAVDADGDDDTFRIDAAIAGQVQASLAVSVDDTVVRAIRATPSSFAAVEGETRQLEVVLTASPPAPLVVRARSEDTAVAVVTPAIAFNSSNWNVPQRLSVVGVRDADPADEATTIVLEADGYQAARVATTVADPDVQELLVSLGLLRVIEGSTSPVVVALRRPPGRPIVVTAAIAGTGVATVAPAELTFTDANWSVAQRLTLTGVRDSNVVDDRTELRLHTDDADDVVREVETVDTRVP
jgi:hypothetical protein